MNWVSVGQVVDEIMNNLKETREEVMRFVEWSCGCKGFMNGAVFVSVVEICDNDITGKHCRKHVLAERR